MPARRAPRVRWPVDGGVLTLACRTVGKTGFRAGLRYGGGSSGHKAAVPSCWRMSMFAAKSLPGLLLPLILLLPACSALAASDGRPDSRPASSLEGLAETIEAGRERFGIPGMAVGVVHDDAVIHLAGYGRLHQDRDRAVDPDTLFGVASITKAMTAAVLASLVDAGELGWDDRVVDHLPWFRLKDPCVTREVRIRDLLSHQVGVGRMTGNRLQFMPQASREAVIRQMRYHRPEAPFRSRYVYSNVMYSVAGEVAAAITGQTWEELVHERLFSPLNMNRSNTSITEFAAGDTNIAYPHQEIDGELVTIERRNFDNVAPAASVNASVQDMVQWLRLQLGEPGVYAGQRLFSEEVMAQMHSPQVVLDRSDRTEPVRAYGLGWSMNHYQGFQLLQHGGATDGFNTLLVMVPELDLGIVVVTNTFETYRTAVVNTIIDRIADLPETDWTADLHDEYRERYAEVQAERQAIHEQRQTGTKPSLTSAQLIGEYHDDLYGTARVFANDHDGLSVEFFEDGHTLLDLEHWHHDTWRARYRNQAQREKFMYFTRAADGGAGAMEVRWTLRPELLQVGLYPASYYRDVRFRRVAPE
ncbi:MAG: serine hydrolase [Wenzhouxiangella sp.]|nr:MAG: serine hydrolase [Wenzhouxiangella sp.]